jgi:Tol biopolymer transport system component
MANGKEKTEIFVVDLPEDLTLLKDNNLALKTERIKVPKPLQQRRITQLPNGIVGPRQWLKSTADGSLIVFLTKDSSNITNAFGVSPNGGPVKQLTFHTTNIQTGLSVSNLGKKLLYVVDKTIIVTDLDSGLSQSIAQPYEQTELPINCLQFSPNDKQIAFNKYCTIDGVKNLQIFTIDL